MRFVLIFGPPAVGKMTVGRRLASRAGMRLFHNHAVLEPLLDVFDYGTPPFDKLLNELRHAVIAEAAAAEPVADLDTRLARNRTEERLRD